MAYSAPPGVSKPATPLSLPPRPPARASGFNPAFSAASPPYAATPPPGYPTTSFYAPATSFGAPAATSSYAASPALPSYNALAASPTVGAGRGGYSQAPPPSLNYPQSGYHQASWNPGANAGYSAPPQIRNPFPAPGAPTAEYEPEMAAQIAQWQSAYMPKDPSDPSSKGNAVGARPGAAASASHPADASSVAACSAADEKKKTVYRAGGGQKWQDDTLLEWDPSHLRLFVGNLAGETTDESLFKAFSRWKSVQKAKVVRDKRTTKSKGYGFVSFSDADDFFQAAKEMNGKYIQSHPVVVHKAKTEIKPAVVKDNRRGKHGKPRKGNDKKSGNGMGQDPGVGAYEPHLGPAGGGIHKPGQKTRSGLKLLG